MWRPRTAEQLAAAHHVRLIRRRGDAEASAAAERLKAEVDAAARKGRA